MDSRHYSYQTTTRAYYEAQSDLSKVDETQWNNEIETADEKIHMD